jgi:hypothetical protein
MFPRIPALQGFFLNDRDRDRPVGMIGVRHERSGTRIWFSDEDGDNSYEYNLRAVALPSGTIYKSVKGRYDGRGNGCVTRDIIVNCGTCPGTQDPINCVTCPGIPVLRGFSFKRDNARHIDRIKVRVYPRQMTGYCLTRVELCLTDRNEDDPYEFWVYYAIVPRANVERVGSFEGRDEGGSALGEEINICDANCEIEPVITGFSFDQSEGWPNNDMRLKRIQVSVGIFGQDDLRANVIFDDLDGKDNYDWKVYYALITA